MALPCAVDLEFYQGDTFTTQVNITSIDGSAPPDISGYAVLSQIRYDIANKSPIVVSFTAVITGPQSIVISLSSAQTTLLCGTYVWDLQLSSAGTVTTIVAGNVKVMPEVSR